MIEKAEIISPTNAGDFEERIYDNESPWNSQSWTWIKFTNDDFTEWIGQFRGSPRQLSLSKILENIIVLTSDYAFRLDTNSGNLLELIDQPQWHNLTVAPSGEFIFADDYQIEKMDSTLTTMSLIESPIRMDMIKFQEWNGDKLEFDCDEFMNWERQLKMQLCSTSWKIEIKKRHTTSGIAHATTIPQNSFPP